MFVRRNKLIDAIQHGLLEDPTPFGDTVKPLVTDGKDGEIKQRSAVHKHGLNYVMQPPASAQQPENFARWCSEIGRKLIRADLGDVDMIPFITEEGNLIMAFDVSEERAPLVQAALFS